MRLTFLGAGDAFSGNSCNAAALIDHQLLIDCGAPVHVQVRRAGIAVESIRAVLITHFHADHTYALPMLIGALAFTVPERGELRIAGPVGTEEYVRRIIATGYGRHLAETLADNLEISFVPLQDGDDAELIGYRVRPFAMVHSTGPSLSYAVTGDEGVTIGFTGDTTMCTGLHHLASISDAVVAECSGWDEPAEGGHLWRDDIAQLMQTYPDVDFILNHQVAARGTSGALAAHDLLSLEVRRSRS